MSQLLKFRKKPVVVDMLVWDGTEADATTITVLAGEQAAVTRVYTQTSYEPVALEFWCEASKARVRIEPHGALAREPGGWYPILPGVLATMFDPV